MTERNSLTETSGIDSYGQRESKIEVGQECTNVTNQFKQQSMTERNHLTETSGIDSYGPHLKMSF